MVTQKNRGMRYYQRTFTFQEDNKTSLIIYSLLFIQYILKN
jgi:hypothetical protein